MTNLPATVSSNAGPIGLEEIDSDDLVMPTLTISHKEGKYVDGLSGEQFDTLEVVLLGLIKQRILWDVELEDGQAPLCKSYDHATGVPDPKSPARFPWRAAGFEQSDYDTGSGDALAIPCDKCALKEWGSHPKNDTPWCTEQHVFAVMMRAGEDFASPAVLTLQRTGIKASRAYLTSFHRARTPLFVVTTKLGLSLQRKGSVNYAVPTLVRGTPTDELDHEMFADNFRRIRDFLRTPRVPVEAEPVTVKTSAPAAAPAAAELDDDEMPF